MTVANLVSLLSVLDQRSDVWFTLKGQREPVQGVEIDYSDEDASPVVVFVAYE